MEIIGLVFLVIGILLYVIGYLSCLTCNKYYNDLESENRKLKMLVTHLQLREQLRTTENPND